MNTAPLLDAESLAAKSPAALHNELARLRKELQQRDSILTAAGTLDVQQLTSSLLTTLRDIVPFDYAGLELLNDDGDTFSFFVPEIYVSNETKRNYAAIPPVYLHSDPPDSLISTVFRERRSVYLAETNPDELPPFQKAHYRITPWVSLLLVPMESFGRVIGAAIFSGKQRFNLGEQDIQSVERYVQQFTFAFVNARQYYQLQKAQAEIQENLQAVEQQKRLFEQAALEAEIIELFVRVINREKEFEPLLRTILYQIGYIIPKAEKASVLVYEAQTDHFRFLQVAGYNFEEFRPVVLTRHDTLERWVKEETKAADGIFIVRSFSRSKFETVKSPPECALAIRLEVEGNLAGLIFLDNFTSANAFSNDDVRRAASLLEHINVAFAKALALQRLRQQRKQLQESYNYLGVLSDIARDINSTLDLETVLGSIYKHVNRLMDAGYFSIGLFDAQKNVLHFEFTIREGKRDASFETAVEVAQFGTPQNRSREEIATQHLAAWCVRNRKDLLIEDEQRFEAFDAVFDEKNDVVPNDVIPNAATPHENTLSDENVVNDSPMLFLPQKTGKHAAAVYLSHTPQSQMFVLLVVRQTIVGIVVAQSPRKNAYTRYHVDMLRSIAANAASALVNAESYSEIQRQQQLLERQAAEIQLINTQLVEQNQMLERSEELLAAQAREVEEINTTLQQTNLELAQMNTEKNELLGIVAHDLKNPLASILMSIEILQRFATKITDQERDQRLNAVRESVMRMNGIVGHLLDMNMLETGVMHLEKQSVNLATLAAEVVSGYEERAALKDIALHLHRTIPEHECCVQADMRVLREVLENLVSNAVKFSPFGKNVFIRLNTSNDALRVEIQDEGPGVSPEDMQKLFGKFARLSARPTGGEHSTGLGLSIVKKMVEAMNGRVWCESELGDGAAFIVELPCV